MTTRRRQNLLAVLLFAVAMLLCLGALLDSKIVTRATGQSLPAIGARPLGALNLGAPTTAGCPSGFTCNIFTVSVPGVTEDEKGVIADQKPAGAIKGMIMFFSGTTGTGWWSGTSSLVPAFFQSLLNSGYELVQVAWSGNGWVAAPVGEPLGQEVLAARPATVIQWVHDNMYSSSVGSSAIGHCGFCITGNSAGASQVAYAVSSYGLDTIVDAMIPSSGPPMAALAKGCLQVPGYAYDPSKAALIDVSYGFYARTGAGPCATQDPAFTAEWAANANETGGTNYNYPATRVHMILGGRDQPLIINHATDYYDVLMATQQPMLTWQEVPTMAHEITVSQDGLNALLAALTE